MIKMTIIKHSFFITFYFVEDSGSLFLKNLDADLGTCHNLSIKDQIKQQLKNDQMNHIQNIEFVVSKVLSLLEKDDIETIHQLSPYLFKKKSKILQFILENLSKEVPRNNISTYKDVAVKLGLQPTHARVVAKALATNDYLLIYPCHRVVPSSGGIGKKFGATGGLLLKRELLKNEGISVSEKNNAR